MLAGVEGQSLPGRAALATAGEGGNSYCPQTDIEPIKQQRGFFTTKRWPPEDVWLRNFLYGPEAFFIPLGTLDDPVWWESVSVACGGLDREFIRREFAKMRAYLSERNLRFAAAGPEQCKDLCPPLAVPRGSMGAEKEGLTLHYIRILHRRSKVDGWHCVGSLRWDGVRYPLKGAVLNGGRARGLGRRYELQFWQRLAPSHLSTIASIPSLRNEGWRKAYDDA
jgi:hypothetical protein